MNLEEALERLEDDVSVKTEMAMFKDLLITK